MKSATTVVIVGSETDPHISSTVTAFRRREIGRNLNCLVIDVDQSVQSTLALTDRSVKFQSTSKVMDVRAFWFQLKRPSSYFLTHAGDAADIVRETEWLGYTRGLWELFGEVAINKAHAVSRASLKVLQLHIAKNCGFATPTTLFSNEKQMLKEFCEHGSFVIKGISADHFIPPDSKNSSRIIETRPLTFADIVSANSSVIQNIPNFVQTRIAKVAEWRISVFGSRHFAVRFEPLTKTQSVETDWRRNYRSSRSVATEVPRHISEGIDRYMTQFDLKCATFDFGETAEGELIFFECNPGGQWAWLDETGEYAEAMAEVLVDVLQSPL
jgi:glutathione synthase/RimK-type ligase-like ATP-grasp enzyme